MSTVEEQKYANVELNINNAILTKISNGSSNLKINLPHMAYFNKENNTGDPNTSPENSFEKGSGRLYNSCNSIFGPDGVTATKGLFGDATSSSGVLEQCDSAPGNSNNVWTAKKQFTDLYKDNPLETVNILTRQGCGNVVGNAVNQQCGSDDGKAAIANQINYLSCQLAKARSRAYNSADFGVGTFDLNIKKMFEDFKGLRSILVLLFILTMYFLINGFFSSLDVSSNIFGLISEFKTNDFSYWFGMMIGISSPFFVLIGMFSSSVKQDLSLYDNLNITDNAFGQNSPPSSGAKDLDYSLVVLFLVFLFMMVAFLFTFNKSTMSNIVYTSLVTGVLILITIIFFLFYLFIPFFTTADESNIGQQIKTEFFVKDDEDVVNIFTNKISKTRSMFLIMVLLIFFLSIAFFIKGKKKIDHPFFNPFFNGLTGAFAILLLPCLWLFNIVLGIQFFFCYPMILIGFRFLRYIGMSVAAIMYRGGGLQGASDDFKKELQDFKNYSPSWGFVGVDIIKTIMNIMGYENTFSKKFVNNNNSQKEIDGNKYVFSGIFSAITLGTGTKSFGYSVVVSALTIILSLVILYGVMKIEKT